jgi:adenosylcobinamide-phosphate synthase
MNWFSIQGLALTGLDPRTDFCIAFAAVATLLLALWIDRVWGEPPAAWHSVVWMGQYLDLCGRISTRFQPVAAFLAGAVAWWAGVVCVGFLASFVQVLAFRQIAAVAAAPGFVSAVSSVLLLVALSWLLKTMLSWRMLRSETLAVEFALQQSLEAGRSRLSMLVSRDTSELGESEVRESAIESLAENLNDSVVAPVFWFLVFGLPGAAIYRFANTADAMWGYRGVRHGVQWEWAGKWAAWADDALSWVPARITAMLLLLAALDGSSLRRLPAEARKTPSPNSGWPMAAMALTLDICLRKPGVYALNASGRLPVAPDAVLASALASRVVGMIAWSALPWGLLVALPAFLQ